MPDNPIIPNTATPTDAIPGDAAAGGVLNTAAIANSNAVTSTPEPRFSQGSLVADDIMIYDNTDSSFVACMPDYAKYILNISTSQIFGVASFDELFSKLAEYQTIKRLFLFMHGADGVLIFEGQQKTLNQLIASYQNDIKTKVTELIQFEGCNVGNSPFQLKYFMDFFGCQKISGRNMYHVLKSLIIPIVGGDAMITRSQLTIPEEFLLTTSYLDAIESTLQKEGSTVTPIPRYHWFRDIYDETVPNSGYNEREFYSLDDTQEDNIAYADVKEEYEVSHPGIWLVSVLK